MDDTFGTAISIFFAFCIGLPMFLLFLGSIVWAYQDAEKRGRSGCLVALLVFLVSWPAGLIIWLLIRPNGKLK